ncbi:MAG TPA: ROK family protein [Acidimicrobiales bacterium]|nr:ROK family protein [Acidimicrobiales bacterium]
MANSSARDATVGVDIGGTKVLAVLLGAGDDVLAEAEVPTPRTGEEMLDAVAAVVTRLSGGDRGTAVGVGAPGLVDRDGVLRFAPNLPGIVGLAVRDGLAARIAGPRLLVGNDASCAGWAEWVLGAAQGAGTAVMVTLGTGIGGGIVTNGAVFEGEHGFAGEIGHMVVEPNGPRCPCGKKGCWERFASGSGLGRLAREAAEAGHARRVVELAGGDPDAVRGEHVTRAAAEGDAEAREVMASFAWWLALGLANLANILDPDCFVLGGGLIRAGTVLIEPTRAAFAELVEAVEHRPHIPIRPARLGERAGAIGAGLLARRVPPAEGSPNPTGAVRPLH